MAREENGTNVQFSFQAPITGSEADNFNTMMSTGEYTDIIDLAVASDTTPTLVNEGILMDLTDYVEEYMPNLCGLSGRESGAEGTFDPYR